MTDCRTSTLSLFCPVISANQFNSAVPLHCTDESLLSPSTLAPLSVEIPTFDSHTTQLLKLALKIHK